MLHLEMIRKRPGMFIGSTEQFGIQQLVIEAVDNAVDQFLANKATRLDVQIRGQIIRVYDDGPGFPLGCKDTGCMDTDGVSIGLKHLTEYHNKNTADDHVPHVHAHGFGSGLFALNALTQRLDVTSVTDGMQYSQSFSRGLPLNDIQTKSVTCPNGTSLEFELDEQIFGDQTVDFGQLRTVLRRLSFLFPGLIIRFQDDLFQSSKGLIDLIKYEMGFDSPRTFSISIEHAGALITVAAIGDSEQETQFASFANAVPTLEDSSHVRGLQQALKQCNWNPAGAAISVLLFDPSFAGPTRQVLYMPGFDETICHLLVDPLTRFLSK